MIEKEMNTVGDKPVLGIVCSPNKDGKTFQIVSAALEGAAAAGAPTELVQMSDYQVIACKDCQPWVCNKNLKCTYEKDDPAFGYLSEKVLNCGALVLGNPVYYADTSGMVKSFIQKMYRVWGMSGRLQGLPAVGAAFAGGTGGGLSSGLRPVYHFFQASSIRALAPLPATDLNMSSAKETYREIGAKLAGMTNERQPFAGPEERMLWYESLPYINLSRIEERKLQCALVVEALGENADPEFARGLVRANALLAGGKQLEALKEMSRVYDAGLKAFMNPPVTVKAS